MSRATRQNGGAVATTEYQRTVGPFVTEAKQLAESGLGVMEIATEMRVELSHARQYLAMAQTKTNIEIINRVSSEALESIISGDGDVHLINEFGTDAERQANSCYNRAKHTFSTTLPPATGPIVPIVIVEEAGLLATPLSREESQANRATAAAVEAVALYAGHTIEEAAELLTGAQTYDLTVINSESADGKYFSHLTNALKAGRGYIGDRHTNRLCYNVVKHFLHYILPNKVIAKYVAQRQEELAKKYGGYDRIPNPHAPKRIANQARQSGRDHKSREQKRQAKLGEAQQLFAYGMNMHDITQQLGFEYSAREIGTHPDAFSRMAPSDRMAMNYHLHGHVGHEARPSGAQPIPIAPQHAHHPADTAQLLTDLSARYPR